MYRGEYAGFREAMALVETECDQEIQACCRFSDFPAVFAKRAEVQREIGAGFGFGGGAAQFFLDDLHPDAGRDEPEQDIECDVFCSRYVDVLVQATVKAEVSP